MTTIAERVARGAALLDEKQPGWWQRIYPDIIDIDSCERCVLGQVYEAEDGNDYGYSTGLTALGIDLGGPEHDHGFDCDWDEQEDLTAAWRELIESRRAAS
jgi:hypothetical protein